MEKIKRRDFLAVTGLTRQTLDQWVLRGLVRRPYTQQQAFAVALGRWLRSKGVSIDLAGRVILWLGSTPFTELLAEVNAGKQWLVLELESEKMFLADDQAVFANPTERPTQFFCVDLQVAAGKVWERLASVTDATTP